MQFSTESEAGISNSLDFPSEASTSSASRPKQLIFDRRYGWVFEEWVEPSEHASIGGRGLFSVVPLTVATINLTYQAANAAADLIVHSVKNQPEIATDVRNRWTAARLLAWEQFRERVNSVPFLRKRSASPRHPIPGSRVCRDLTDRGKSLRTALCNQVYGGIHVLQHAFYEGTSRADEQLHRLLPDANGRQKANVQIQEVSPFPPEFIHRLRECLTEASEHLQQSSPVRNGNRGIVIGVQAGQQLFCNVHSLFRSRGVAETNQAVRQLESGYLVLSEVLGKGRAVGHEMSRQANGFFQLVGHVSKDLSSYIVHQTERTLSDVALRIKKDEDTLEVQTPRTQEAAASPHRRGMEDPDYDDVLSRSPLMTMAAAPADDDDPRVEAHISTQSTAHVFPRSTASISKKSKRSRRKARD